MIITCKVCDGRGGTQLGMLGGFSKCGVCHGAGEVEVRAIPERLATCKPCAGRGVLQVAFLGQPSVCQVCAGVGLIERPVVGLGRAGETAAPRRASSSASERPSHFEYDIAVSFAGEDRESVQPYAASLVEHGVKVFFADFEQAELWGHDLYETLDAVYRLKARFCVLFLSQHYAGKMWTTHERKAAQARAVQESTAYILPVRLDDTALPGLSPTVSYIDYRSAGSSGLVDITLRKLAAG